MLRTSLRAKHGVLAVILLVLSVALWIWSPSVYYSPEIRGRILAPNGQPVTDTIVVAGWKVRTMYFNNTWGQLALHEVVTSENGEFSIPAWGPRLLWKGALMIDQPTLRIFKGGYVPLIVRNVEGPPMKSAPSFLRFRLQDQALVIRPFQGSLTAYASEMEPLMSSMDEFSRFEGPDLCYRERIPRLMRAIQDLQKTLDASGAGQSLRHAYARSDRPPCDAAALAR